ncbi:MAG: ThuA domain-containing protein [Bacteroidota bacterium]
MIRTLLISSFILVSLAGCSVRKQKQTTIRSTDHFHPRILVITGGHSYDTTEFCAMFRSMKGITFDTISHPRAGGQLSSEHIYTYDVLVFYDYQPDQALKDSTLYLNLTHHGMPLLFLHHSICSCQRWEGFKAMLGGKYIMEGYGHDSSSLSDYRHDLDLHIRIADDHHPVTDGLTDFDIQDEGYSNINMAEGITPLLLTCSPGSSSPVAWANTFDQSTIICLMLGHDKHAYENQAFQTFLSNSITWLSRKDEDSRSVLTKK